MRIYVFPVRYEYHLHIRSKALPLTGRGDLYVFPVRCEYHLHIKSKALPLTGRGGLYACFLCGTNIIYI
jgi:hypothetical protein